MIFYLYVKILNDEIDLPITFYTRFIGENQLKNSKFRKTLMLIK